MKQVDAVYAAVTNVLGENNINFEDGMNVSSIITTEMRQQVNAILFEGIKGGAIDYKGDTSDDAKVKSYVSGLQSNWLRKDKRLNGNTAYVPKNPGSRTGNSNPEIVAIRTLLSTLTPGTDEHSEVSGILAAEIAKLKPAKTADLSALPESLKRFIK